MSPSIQSMRRSYGYRTQRGVSTLMITLSLLVILTIIVLSSANVALFEEKTATNENRQRLAEQGAEYALSLGGEFLKANVSRISTNVAGGWFDATDATKIRWQTCDNGGITDQLHPCFAEPDPARRTQLYYYTSDGTAVTNPTSIKLNLPYNSLAPGSAFTSVGGAAQFPAQARVRALLCRLDTTPGQTPSCRAQPLNGNRIAVTLISEATITGENSKAVVKETWATFTDFAAVASVPLVAAGLVQGLGNAMIVAAPNAGGYGVPGSIWSPRDIDVDDGGAGIGSVSTCHLGDYLHSTSITAAVPISSMKTTCAATNDPCNCTASPGSLDFLSGHTNGVAQENIDIIDVDHLAGDPATSAQPLPDITFFPGSNRLGQRMDDNTDNTDDTLFEWIFGRDVTGGNGQSVLRTCGANTLDGDDPNACDLEVLESMEFQAIADCTGLTSDSEGSFYVTGACVLPNGLVGSPTKNVILVVNDNISVQGNTVFYGLLFVRDQPIANGGADCADNSLGNPAPGACMTGTGGKFFGSVVVEGDIKLAGSPHIIYVDSGVKGPNEPLPATTRFARLPGSWLDNESGF